MPTEPAAIVNALIAWYDVHRRVLPWRMTCGEAPDPYAVWLSEIMLQQTTVTTVRAYYGNFLAKWPQVGDLASASLDDVLHAWQGLGYYSRARNLHKCSQVVTAEYGGRFPDTELELLALPGVGPYTAAAIAAIAFGRKATPVDGNIERVMARLYAVAEPLPKSKPLIRKHAQALTPTGRAGDFAQALMDLGATLCKPKSVNCLVCPLSGFCLANRENDPTRYPLRAPKKARPTRYGVIFWAMRSDGAVLVRRRPETGLLGGMIEFPTTEWRELAWEDDAWRDWAPAPADWCPLAKPVIHGFTHFRLELTVVRSTVGGVDGKWCHPDDFSGLALPTVMKKVATAVAQSP